MAARRLQFPQVKQFASAGELADDFLLVAAFEVKTAEVSTRRGGVFAHHQQIVTAGNGVEHGFIVFQ